jgi:predicted permease
MLAKLIVILFLVLILYCLGSGLYFLVTEKQDTDRVVTALTWRIVLSLILFALLFVAYWLGWIHPHGIGM